MRVRAISTTSRGLSTPAATAAAGKGVTGPAHRPAPGVVVCDEVEVLGQRLGRRASPAHPVTRRARFQMASPRSQRPGGGRLVTTSQAAASVSASASRALTRPLCTRRSRTTSRSPRSMDKSARAASGSLGATLARRSWTDMAGRPSASRRASNSARSGRAPGVVESAVDAAARRSRLGAVRASAATWSAERTGGGDGWVMAPSRHIGFPETFREWFPNRSPARISSATFSLVMAFGNLSGNSVGNPREPCGSPPGGPRAARRPTCRPRGRHSPARRNATRRRSRSRRSRPRNVALDVVGPGPAQCPEGGREAHALGGELPGVAEGVGVVAQAQGAEVPAAPERPGRLDHGHDVGAQCQALDLGPGADPMGQPRRPVRRLGGVLGDVGGDGRGVGVVTGHEHPDVELGAPAGPAQCRPPELGHRHGGLGDDRGRRRC